MTTASPTTKSHWLDHNFLPSFKITWETAIIALLLIAAIATRFYGLGDRTMSHDETTHVLFSWELSQGNGYSHDPLSHGPFQFHVLALSYFLFGDNDFTARAPQALFSVATVLFAWWAFRRYIGRVGALLAAAFFLISPYMLYYGRYARNEAFVALFGLVMIWGILRYLDTGKHKYLYIMTAALSLHFASKETAFIYAAQMLIFLGLLFLFRISSHSWVNPSSKRSFFIVFALAASLLILALGAVSLESPDPGIVSGSEVAEPVSAGDELAQADAEPVSPVVLILAAAGLAALGFGLYTLVRGYGWANLRAERSFGAMLLMFALVLPHLGAFPIKLFRPELTFSYYRNVFIGIDPGSVWFSPDFGNIALLVVTVALLMGISAVLGFIWNGKVWLTSMAIFFAIFLPLFTTMFTNSLGLFTGLVGSLGYWLEQQAVQRGNQPPYYYLGLQVPIYEFLALAGTVLAAVVGFRIWSRERNERLAEKREDGIHSAAQSRRVALWMLAFWAVSAMAAYTIAGEKMPWLTVHIALPMLLLAGWALGRMIVRTNWTKLRSLRGVYIMLAMVLFVVSLTTLIVMWVGTNAPFRGMQQVQIQNTLRFVLNLLIVAGSGYALWRLRKQEDLGPRQLTRVWLLVLFAGLAALTARAAFRANYLHYDLATEYLVYAHMARGPKEMMEQLEELSVRLTDSLDIQVAYDNETNYPLWWYLRNYPNKHYYDVNPTASLRDFPVIIVGDANYSKLEPVVRDDFFMYEFVRIWWPNQDYFDFTPESVGFEFTSETGLTASEMSIFDYAGRVFRRLAGYFDTPEERDALIDVWLNRDFTEYLTLKGQEPSLARWNPSRTMRMYIRKDIAAQIWDFGVAPVALEPDPLEGKGVELAPDLVLGGPGTAEGQFASPRDIAVAPDGTLYVADSLNHRIQHLAADGTVINSWGAPSAGADADNPGGFFNEPWGVAVSPDGQHVYVADTWNHRVQKFTADGDFVTMWGIFANDLGESSLYGPRDVVVASDGSVLVTDTGNKRIVVYDANGNYLSSIGGTGFDLGQFEEPVGITYDLQSDTVYVADTWNQRIQVLSYQAGLLTPQSAWDVEGWFGQSLANKPYLSFGPGRLFVADPESARVLVYTPDGTLAYYFGGFDQTAVTLGSAQAVAFDDKGGLWLSDAINHTLLHFILP